MIIKIIIRFYNERKRELRKSKNSRTIKFTKKIDVKNSIMIFDNEFNDEDFNHFENDNESKSKNLLSKKMKKFMNIENEIFFWFDMTRKKHENSTI